MDFTDEYDQIKYCDSERLLEQGLNQLIEYKPDLERFAKLRYLKRVESIGDHYIFDEFVTSGSQGDIIFATHYKTNLKCSIKLINR